MIERALLIRLARVLATSLNLRPVRTTVDAFGTMSHFVSQVRRPKVDFKFEGVWSKRITTALTPEFPEFKILVHEARVPLILPDKVISVPYLSGLMSGPAPSRKGEAVVILFSIDPIGTLTIRQQQRNVLDYQEQTAPGNIK